MRRGSAINSLHTVESELSHTTGTVGVTVEPVAVVGWLRDFLSKIDVVPALVQIFIKGVKDIERSPVVV